jgi:acyl transferase domain-containing protein/short-subunit dehydrogenase/acyl carrier protein
MDKYNGLEIAVIGMSAKFPGSKDFNTYWDNLKEGRDLVKQFSDEELIQSGVISDKLTDTTYMRSFGLLEDKDSFDNDFFGYTLQEAHYMDPQIRIFHEQCWKALEDSGYAALVDKYKIGLFCGAADNINWKAYALASQNGDMDSFYTDLISNEKNISTLISYKLNLTGPAVYINTACSTSLVAVNSACKSLLTRECAIAMAGGVSIRTQLQKGYQYEEGMILSKDGYCRAFDKDASGTIVGEGAGVVVLKRLSEAIKDNDNIYAIIKSSAINNDGNNKVGYTAPSVKGQADCIKIAHKLAGIDSTTINYVEAHGTGTVLGDPIEIRALNEAFGISSNEKKCAIGSVKTNMGHLDAAAGIAGLIKVILSIKNEAIPPSLNFKISNPEIEFDRGPFYVNTKLKKWEKSLTPRRAGVSSFGIGGTNAHVILEEAPRFANDNFDKEFKILPLSAKTKNSLDRYSTILKDFVNADPNLNISDLVFTFQTARKHFDQRKFLIFNNANELIQSLELSNPTEKKITSSDYNDAIVFMFPGQGSQYINMGKDLYINEEAFRIEMDKGFSIIEKTINLDLKKIIFPDTLNDLKINETIYTQPLLFIIEYALAKTIMSFGIRPKFMIGHSIGEYVAACISGVFSFEDALLLVLKRAQLMNSVSEGAMLMAQLNEPEARSFISDEISLAAINSDEQVVFSGSIARIADLALKFDEINISTVKLHTSHAFHSYMLDNVLSQYQEVLNKVQFNKTQLPFFSNLTGKLIPENEIISPDYWVNHLRETVLFSKGIQSILKMKNKFLFIEIGPGNTLTNLLKQNSGGIHTLAFNLLKHPKEKINDCKYFNNTLAFLWLNGIKIDWNVFHLNKNRKKISVPTYSFEPSKHITEVDPFKIINKGFFDTKNMRQSSNNWIHKIVWKQAINVNVNDNNYFNKNVLVFLNDETEIEKINFWLSPLKENCFFVIQGSCFIKKNETTYIIDPYDESNFLKLFEDLKSRNILISDIVHLWTFDRTQNVKELSSLNVNFYKQIGYESLLNVARSYTSIFNSLMLNIHVISNGLFKVLGNELIEPAKTLLLAAVRIIPKEFDNISCKGFDVFDLDLDTLKLIFNNNTKAYHNEFAIRGKTNFIKSFEKINFEIPNDIKSIKKGGAYLISGASGGMGKIFAMYLAKEYAANLILVSRNEIPSNFISILQQTGSKTVCIKSDITDTKMLENEIRKAESFTGLINGVIHTAGIADFSGVILNRKPKNDENIFKPKLFGTLSLFSVFEKQNLDFFINCSSLAASLAPFGQVAYVASNIYQDSFAEAADLKHNIISIEFTTLKETGMAVNATDHLTAAEQHKQLEIGIDPAELINVFLSALYLKIPVPIISTVEINNYLKPETVFGSGVENKNVLNQPVQERPTQSIEYELPVTDVEIKLTQLLENLFGFKNIGVNDDFYELGGDSLKAMMILKKIKLEFGVDILLKDFFEFKNIREISEFIDEKLWINSKSEKKFGSII